MDKKYFLVLDAGTTGVKAFVFNDKLKAISRAYQPLTKVSPKPGWVEQDPDEIIRKSKEVLLGAVYKSGVNILSLTSFGIANQRETTIVWDKKTGRSIYPAIVWEDSRAKDLADKLRDKFGGIVKKKTGLEINSYFSALKVSWIIKNIMKAKNALKNKRLAFGTVDSWLLWNLLEDNPHITDYTNASRTLLFNIRTLKWDKDLLNIFSVPENALPALQRTHSFFGRLKKDVVGIKLPVRAVCGDQQASMYAAGTKKGSTKVTYGTGTFIMQSIGSKFLTSNNFFTTLIPGVLGKTYALEAKIGKTGVQASRLLKDGAGLMRYLDQLAREVDGYIKSLPFKPRIISIDGGMTRDGLISKIQAKVSGIPIKDNDFFDGTALGVAKLLKEDIKML